MPYTRWTLLVMQEDPLQRDLPAPDEAYARHHCLHRGVEVPDLATIKGFFLFFHRYELRQDRGETHGRFD